MAVLVLVMMVALFAPLITAQQNSIEMSISANNAASNHGLVQLHFSFNSSAAQELQFRLGAAPCPADGPSFTEPGRGYQRLWPFSCLTQSGHGYGFTTEFNGLGDCQLAFTFPHVDANNDVTCWVQWSTPLKNETSTPLSLMLDPAYTRGPRVTLAAPLVLMPPTDWSVSSEDWTFGELSITYEKGE